MKQKGKDEKKEQNGGKNIVAGEHTAKEQLQYPAILPRPHYSPFSDSPCQAKK